MPQPPPILDRPRPQRFVVGAMRAKKALGDGWRSLAIHPLAAYAGLLPLAPIAVLSALRAFFPQPLFATACSCASFLFLGPAMIGSWRHYLVLIDGSRPSPRDWLAGYPFLASTVAVNILRILAVLIVVVPTVLAATAYLVLAGAGIGRTSPLDFVVFVALTTPAAVAVVSVKCLTYPFEILLADGRSKGFWRSLDQAVRLAWSNIKPIAWIFTSIGLVAIPLFVLAYFAVPFLPHNTVSSPAISNSPFSESLTRLQTLAQATKIALVPLMPWIFLSLTHAHRQAMPAHVPSHLPQSPPENAP